MTDSETTGTYLVVDAVHLHPLCPLGIQIVPQNPAALFRRGHGKRPDSRHYIRHDIAWVEELDEALVLGVQARVPVDLFEVEGEGAIGLVLLVSQEAGQAVVRSKWIYARL